MASQTTEKTNPQSTEQNTPLPLLEGHQSTVPAIDVVNGQINGTNGTNSTNGVNGTSGAKSKTFLFTSESVGEGHPDKIA